MTQPPVGPGSPGPGRYETPGLGPSPDPLNPAQAGDTTGTSYAETGYVGTVGTESAPSGSSAESQSSGDATGTAKEVAGTAKAEVGQVADTAVRSGKEVAETAKTEVGNVAAETKQQAASLLDTVRSEVGQQVGTQQQRIAEAVRALSTELDSMASSSHESGPLTDLAWQASRKGGEIAEWLQDKEPTDVLDSVRSYARRRPGTFLVLCGLAGVVAGRLTRSAVATRTSQDTKDGSDTSAPRRELDTASTYSSGVYGTSVAPTHAPPVAPYDADPAVPNPGYSPVSATAFDRLDGDPTR